MSKTKDKINDDEKKRKSFATIIYPESTNMEQLREKIRELQIPIYISPLHDKDIDENGKLKKAHYHLQIVCDGPIPPQTGINYCKFLGGVGYKLVFSVRGMARYLCHLDEEDKVKYSTEEVKEYNGITPYSTHLDEKIETYVIIRQILEFIEEYDILSFRELMIYCSIHKMKSWYPLICDKTSYVIKEYLRSRSWDKTNAHKSKLDLI